MSTASRFRRQPEAPGARLRLTLDGEPFTARAGDSLAAALLAHSANPTGRTARQHAPRGPHCMMGVCFECRVEVDGRPNVLACMTEVRDGMTVRRQGGAAMAGPADD